MKTIHLISVGKLKDKSYKKIEEDYYKRISSFQVITHEEKSHKENLTLEAKEVILKIKEIHKKSNAQIVLLTEKGTKHTSPEFSKWLFKLFSINDQIIFIIGGSSGHGEQLYKMTKNEVSLSALTFPHHMTRAILAEQLYRAETIESGHPYSK
jgi:23S rRNA (pseudouridine1915-N3)-methyltransferase